MEFHFDSPHPVVAWRYVMITLTHASTLANWLRWVKNGTCTQVLSTACETWCCLQIYKANIFSVVWFFYYWSLLLCFFFLFLVFRHLLFSPLKCQPNKMVKQTQTIRQLLPTNCLSVFDHFVGSALKGLTFPLGHRLQRMYEISTTIMLQYWS